MTHTALILPSPPTAAQAALKIFMSLRGQFSYPDFPYCTETFQGLIVWVPLCVVKFILLEQGLNQGFDKHLNCLSKDIDRTVRGPATQPKRQLGRPPRPEVAQGSYTEKADLWPGARLVQLAVLSNRIDLLALQNCGCTMWLPRERRKEHLPTRSSVRRRGVPVAARSRAWFAVLARGLVLSRRAPARAHPCGSPSGGRGPSAWSPTRFSRASPST